MILECVWLSSSYLFYRLTYLYLQIIILLWSVFKLECIFITDLLFFVWDFFFKCEFRIFKLWNKVKIWNHGENGCKFFSSQKIFRHDLHDPRMDGDGHVENKSQYLSGRYDVKENSYYGQQHCHQSEWLFCFHKRILYSRSNLRRYFLKIKRAQWQHGSSWQKNEMKKEKNWKISDFSSLFQCSFMHFPTS